MSVKRLLALFNVLILIVLLSGRSLGADSVSLVQAYAWEDTLDVFTQGAFSPDSLSCRISNQDAEIVRSGSLADMGVTVQTQLLVDVSTSMPAPLRDKVLAVMDALIASIPPGEQYQLAAIGEQVSVLQPFTSDRYDLAVGASKIAFNGQESRIYDAVYNTLPQIAPLEEGKPCFYRTVILTDGVDLTDTGVTVEELYLKLQSSTYPIDVVDVGEKSAPDRELSALARISGGRYFSLNGTTDPAALAASLGVGDVYWTRLKAPEALLDGSTRQVNLSDGSLSLEFDCKFPVFGTPETSSAPPEPPPVSSAVPVILPEPAPEPEKSLLPVLLIAGAAVIAVSAAVLTVLLLRKRGKQAKPGAGGLIPPAQGGQGTELLSADGRTQLISSTAPSVRLRSTADASQVWELVLGAQGQEVRIGRSPDCRICLPEASVSREQCRLYYDGGIYAENISGSNVTQLNGEPLKAPALLAEGDLLKCGRISLIVEAVTISGGGNLNKKTAFINI